MAYGLSPSANGGVMSSPSVPGLGQDQWAMMSGANPSNALIGGYAGSPGYLGGQRKIATSPNATAAVAAGQPGTQSWSQLFNLKGNPIGWILILLLVYVAITHMQMAKKLPHLGK
jgi:hypothetical protein